MPVSNGAAKAQSESRGVLSVRLRPPYAALPKGHLTAVAEGWAYYNFIGDNGEQKQTAKAFGKQACWSCHKEHAAKDNVFVQFYPRLRDKD